MKNGCVHFQISAWRSGLHCRLEFLRRVADWPRRRRQFVTWSTVSQNQMATPWRVTLARRGLDQTAAEASVI